MNEIKLSFVGPKTFVGPEDSIFGNEVNIPGIYL